MPRAEVISVEMLTEAEKGLAERIEQAIERISALQRNCVIGGMLSLVVLLAPILLFTPLYLNWPERVSDTVGRQALPVIAFLAVVAVAAIGYTLWYLLYARPRIGRQLAILRELSANSEMPHLRRKLYQMRAAWEKLGRASSLELQFASAHRSIRRLFPEPTRG